MIIQVNSGTIRRQKQDSALRSFVSLPSTSIMSSENHTNSTYGGFSNIANDMFLGSLNPPFYSDDATAIKS